MKELTSQLAQELVDHIMAFLHDSPADWPACALVSRACVHTAQSYIFRQICFLSAQSVNEDRWARFQRISDTSPHLIRYIRQLHIIDFAVSPQTFLAICNFPFVRLDGASVHLKALVPSSTLAMQQLLSLSTLRRVQISCNSTSLQDFSQIWDRCSRSLKHLELTCYLKDSQGFHSVQQSSSVIGLESLALRSVGIRQWLTHTHCPLDFSGLRALSMYGNTELLASQRFAPALQSIQTLDLTPEFNKPAVDLSAFPKLTLLRICLSSGSWRWVLATLSTITPSSCIMSIIFVDSFVGIPLDQLDWRLSALPISPRVEFGISPAKYARIIPNFPLLCSKNMLHRADDDPDWFQHVTGTL
ncbi:hypothetical protein C8R44DRAFT_887973 [Mycena epipterygia]|nr:hypothetical protein C8R44DRAFT_887973 [Mycena epipterygia]